MTRRAKTLAVLASIPVAIIASVLVLWMHPETLDHPAVVDLVAQRLARFGISADWKNSHLRAKSLSFWQKEISMEVSGFQWSERNGSARARLKGNLHTSIRLDFNGGQVRPLGITELRWEEGAVEFAIPTRKERGPIHLPPNLRSLLGFLRDLQAENVTIPHFKWMMRTPHQLTQGEFSIHSGNQNELRVELLAEGATGRANVSAHLGHEGAKMRYSVALAKGGMLEGRANGGWNGKEGALTTDFKVSGFDRRWKEASATQCKLIFSGKSEWRLAWDCPGQVVAGAALKQVQKLLELGADRTVRARLTGELKGRFNWEQFVDQIEGQTCVRLEPRLNSAAQTSLEFRSDGLIRPWDPISEWPFHSQMRVVVDVSKFSQLVATLKDTPYAVVAPFHVLDGSIHLESSGTLSRSGGSLPIYGQGLLHSRRQKANLNIDGKFDFELGKSPRAFLDFTLLAQDFVLDIPRLSLTAPPRLYPAVVVHSLGKELKPKRFRTRWRMVTGGKCFLRSNLSRDPVPLKLDINKETDEPVKGMVELGDFYLHLFNRDLHVDHIKFDLREPYRETILDGHFSGTFPEVKVIAALGGTIARPRLLFESDPPLSRRELVAVLLFGKRLNDLEEDQVDSVMNASAAMLDGAMELASLYFLASTPVQSVTYDPSAGSVSVKIGIEDGLTLDLGADAGKSEEIGIRKRLSRNWGLSTDLRHTTSVAASISLMLEWINRY